MPTPRPKSGESEQPEQLGKYRVLHKIAEGGMAEIFLARAGGIEGFEKHVVIKRILPTYARKPKFVQMFLDEARLAARLQHQNIAQVYDIGQEGHTHYFAMEYLHGVDLRKLMQAAIAGKQPLPRQHALTIVAHTAAALDYAHEATSSSGAPLDIVHRDVSPSNIFVTYDGAVKLVDFGIARAAERSAETRTGTLKGKISYMSPEQCKGHRIDRRSDIFSLGIVLYELTTMSRLFRARHETDYVVMDRIVNGDFDPPIVRDPGYPAGLNDIVMRALAIDRERRYATARDLLTDLERFAARAGAPLSSTALSGFVTGLFGRPAEPWIEGAAVVGRDALDGRPRTISTTGVPAIDATADTVIPGGGVFRLPLPSPPQTEPSFRDDRRGPSPLPTAVDSVAIDEVEPPDDDPSAAPPRRGWLRVGILAAAAAAGVAAAVALSTPDGDALVPARALAAPATAPQQPIAAEAPEAPVIEPLAEADEAGATAEEATATAPPTHPQETRGARTETRTRATPAAKTRARNRASNRNRTKTKTKTKTKAETSPTESLIDRSW